MDNDDRHLMGAIAQGLADAVWIILIILVFSIGALSDACRRSEREQTFRKCMEQVENVAECSRLLP